MRFLILFVIILLSACQSPDKIPPKKSANEQAYVLATTGMIGDIVQKIAGEHVNVQVLIPSALDPHAYELVKGDVEKFAEAKIIFYNGLGLEHGVSMRRHLHDDRAVCVTRPLIEESPSSLLQTGGVYDPHVWMDISLWSKILDPICEALSKEFPAHMSYFYENKESLRQEMCKADQAAYEKLQALPNEKRFLVTSHDAFHYFTRRYLREGEEKDWGKRCSAPEGLAPEAELSSVDLLKVLHYIQEHNTQVLFTEANIHAQGLHKLLDTGKKKGLVLRLAKGVLYADSMGQASSYLEMVQHNVDLIVEELSQ